MTKHISRKSLWSSHGPNEHRCAEGKVYFRAGQWHAALTYRITGTGEGALEGPMTWEASKFKRARNAMIALEDKVTELQRRHGSAVSFLL
jgi:hypothetical protein